MKPALSWQCDGHIPRAFPAREQSELPQWVHVSPRRKGPSNSPADLNFPSKGLLEDALQLVSLPPPPSLTDFLLPPLWLSLGPPEAKTNPSAQSTGSTHPLQNCEYPAGLHHSSPALWSGVQQHLSPNPISRAEPTELQHLPSLSFPRLSDQVKRKHH